MYPSHEAQTRPQSPSTVDASPPGHQDSAVKITIQSVCTALKISRATYDMLMTSYFANMTAFSLFRPGSIEPKFAIMQNHSDAEALVAAMFSFSARHCQDDPDCPTPAYFAQIASSQLDESVDRYGDMRPPFWLLQAGVLVTFYQLTLSVRSRSWKKLGDCIRYSYDMNLHIVDANHEPVSDGSKPIDIQRWSLLEERRRAWWATWEMDVFASTIRRLPTAIDPSLNLTLLPVPDSFWFNDVYQESCFLAEDSSLRWKHLEECGNQSAKAWFIVVNSLMRNTQRLVYPAGSAMVLSGGSDKQQQQTVETNREELEIMANCLYCTVTSLPASLSYQGETLDFRPKATSTPLTDRTVNENNPRQEHADKYALHLMTQLCRFMIYHHKICARAPWLLVQQRKGQQPRSSSETAQANSEWSNYMSASDEIVRVVRNSARDHYRYVNPFLANSLWFAAAAQIACKVFGPAALSNLDLLKLTIDRFISFWGGMENLKGKLARIEAGLQNLMSRPSHHETRDEGQNGVGAGDMVLGNENGMARRPSTATTLLATHTLTDHHHHPTANHSGAVPLGTELLLPPAVAAAGHGGIIPNPNGGGHGGWGATSWDAHLYGGSDDHLTHHHFPMTPGQQNLYYGGIDGGPGGPLDFSPFGLEELLMASMMETSQM
ncbi:hypothetical protein B0H66DRAFT_574762 [Apodospora peruviana]|uniref:Xylanolytic transcriptional activator regulatory domain-containing protein n=1 Tax=Apodospora peruviana TaxID=516989 RepID=A0AAE0M985_9PEZI|nr:hypothetical protein B0H66DRAFT_574762 [Apodospora peruviana]